jgi:hypothetical protein
LQKFLLDTVKQGAQDFSTAGKSLVQGGCRGSSRLGDGAHGEGFLAALFP